MEDTLVVLTVVLASLVAGGLLVAEMGLVRTIRSLPNATGIRLHVAFDHYVEWSMPALTIATFIVGVVRLAVFGHPQTAATALTVAALLATVVVAAVSQLINVPLNAAMRTFAPGTVPGEYEGMRRRWNRAHQARTLAGQVALICFVAALVTS
jgi:uncharacterized membrane protein